MNVFQTHAGIIEDYATYIRSFLNIADPTIFEVVEEELSKGKLWPEPLLQFNPSFEIVGSVTDLANTGTLHSDIADIFTGYSLYRHQVEAIQLGTAGKDFIVTSGTGSGKSLTYIFPLALSRSQKLHFRTIVCACRGYPLSSASQSGERRTA